MGIGNDQPCHQLLQFGDQRFVRAVLDDQPPCGGAALAGGRECRLGDQDGCGVDVGRIPDDDWIVAAHLEREDLVGGVRELPVERDAGARGAGEQQAIDARVRRKRLALRRAADDEARGPFRHARFMQAFDQRHATGGRLFAGLEDDGIACEQGGYDVPVGQVHREVVRTEHRQHAMRLVPDGGSRTHRALDAALRGAFLIGADRNLDFQHDRFDFGPCLPQRLAGFAGDSVGECFRTTAHDIHETTQRFRPVGERTRRPFGPRAAGEVDLCIDVADRAPPQDRTRRGFVRDQFGIHSVPP